MAPGRAAPGRPGELRVEKEKREGPAAQEEVQVAGPAWGACLRLRRTVAAEGCRTQEQEQGQGAASHTQQVGPARVAAWGMAA